MASILNEFIHLKLVFAESKFKCSLPWLHLNPIKGIYKIKYTWEVYE